uniref:acetyl-CoA-benzylalcohol acetyltransferase-like n=1 Tax=Erigeron canadensis TaxID=72917 RepID=UPI001CB92A8D|nr:acetyl-CoA-benzylalcohol acetyltransferase-like [Erigeron canadensis]
MEIKIQSTQFIKPSKLTPEVFRDFKLSILDQFAASSYINQVFYYKTSCKVDIPDICGQLVNSLSEILTLFYPLAGRIRETELEVDCSDQGVKYLETQVSISLDKFFELGPKIDHIRRLIRAPDQEKSALLIVQVNIFKCGSLVIGVSGSHKVTDAYNLVRFVNEWASLNRTGQTSGAFSISFDNLDSVFPPKEIESFEDSPVIDKSQTKIVTKRFVFNGSIISKLRAKSGPRNPRHSRVTLVAAIIWKAIISVDQVKSGSLRNSVLAPAINLRGKTRLPISESSFGNVWVPYSIRYLQNEMEPKFDNLVKLIENTTRDVITRLLNATSEEICKEAMACYAEVGEELKQNKFAIFTSWCNFPIYNADFGFGKPCWVSEAGRSLDMVTLMDDKHGDGIEAWVSLNEKDMSVFEQNEDILSVLS